MKVGLIVGHNINRGGAFAPFPIGCHEYVFWDGVLQELPEVRGVEFKVFRRIPAGSYYREIDTVYSAADHWGADATVEFHFNAGGGTGTETLSSGTRSSMAQSKRLQAAMVESLGLRDRGVQVRKRKERGGRSLWAGPAPASMVEPFFGDNLEDCRRMINVGPRRVVADMLQVFAQ